MRVVTDQSTSSTRLVDAIALEIEASYLFGKCEAEMNTALREQLSGEPLTLALKPKIVAALVPIYERYRDTAIREQAEQMLRTLTS